MTLEQIYLISEIVAAFFVVISLGAVALQMRQNTAAVRSGIAQSVGTTYADMFSVLARDPDLLRVFIEGTVNLDRLDKMDRARFFALQNAAAWNWQNMYFQWRQEKLDKGLWESHVRLIANVANQPGFREFWLARQAMFSDQFQAFMEGEVLSKSPMSGFKPMDYDPA